MIAGGAVRDVVEAAGITDLLSKAYGSSSKINNTYAVLNALSQLEPEMPRKVRAVKSKPKAKAKS